MRQVFYHCAGGVVWLQYKLGQKVMTLKGQLVDYDAWIKLQILKDMMSWKK
jgi:hypothetical protein